MFRRFYIWWLRYFLLGQVVCSIMFPTISEIGPFIMIDIVLALLWWRRAVRLAFGTRLQFAVANPGPSTYDQYHEFS